jgi:hypothetical protein
VHVAFALDLPKYPINRDSKVVGFLSQVEPVDPKLTGRIEALRDAE